VEVTEFLLHVRLGGWESCVCVCFVMCGVCYMFVLCFLRDVWCAMWCAVCGVCYMCDVRCVCVICVCCVMCGVCALYVCVV
jgi:hypothetical protein